MQQSSYYNCLKTYYAIVLVLFCRHKQFEVHIKEELVIIQNKHFYPLLLPLWFWFLFLASRYNLSSSNFVARATLPATRVAAGTERSVAPVAEVTTSPPAPRAMPPAPAAPIAGMAGRAAAAAGAAGRKKGFAEAETRPRQRDRVKAIKP